MTAPRAVLVDLGETLLHEVPMDRRVAAEALAADPRFSPFLPSARELEAQHATGAEGSESWTVLAWLKGMLPEALADDAEILVWDRGVRMTPMPGAREALDTLREAKVPVGVVSNTRFSARAWTFGLARLCIALDLVASSADVNARKPDPAIFRAALDRLRVPAHEAWFVGDSFEKDVCGAAAVGMRPVWFGASRPPPRPHPSCTPVKDWAAFLDLWKGARIPSVP